MRSIEPAVWLKLVVGSCGLVVLVAIGVVAPWVGYSFAEDFPEVDYLFWPCLIFIWVSAVPIYVALWQAWRVCSDIERGNSFSAANVRRLRLIGLLAVVVGLMYTGAMIALAVPNLLHPGVALMTMLGVFLCYCFAAAGFALSRLAARAGELQQENELTI